MKTLFFTLLFGLIGFSIFSQNEADHIVGYWLNAKKNAEIKIYKENEKYYGKVLSVDSLEKADLSNASEAERQEKIKSLEGQIILSDFVYKNNKWIQGFLYAPQKKQVLSCVIDITSDHKTLNLEISKGWFSKTIQWTRISK